MNERCANQFGDKEVCNAIWPPPPSPSDHITSAAGARAAAISLVPLNRSRSSGNPQATFHGVGSSSTEG